VIQTARNPHVEECSGLATKARTYIEEIDSMFEGAGISVASLDCDLRVLEASGTFFDGHSVDLVGRDFVGLLHPSSRENVRRQFGRLVGGERTRFVEPVVAGGREPGRCGELVGVAVQGDAGQSASIVVLVKTERMDRGGRLVTSKKILSEIDARILEGVAAGESTIRLASKLYLSRQGVEYHVCRMMRKLKVPNRAALVSKAYSIGILRVREWPPRVFAECVK
jgi:DNA-binding CsgD family transcriptional regulator